MNMSIEAAYRRAMETVVDFVNTQLVKDNTRIFFRTYSPNHFRFFFLPITFVTKTFCFNL